jgi:uncharacterized protein with NRDE domain
MCTLTYLPVESGFVLTSNRDEHFARPTSAPQWHPVHGQKLFFPKDEISGGTWIALNNSGHFACLLNGAFEKHIRKQQYRRSRGQVLLEFFEYNEPLDFWNKVDLTEIEPFTIVAMKSQDHFYEFRWDEKKKFHQKLNPDIPQIWSSATLYDAETQLEKKAWFNEWLETNSMHPFLNILQFHQSVHPQNPKKNIVLSRPDGVQTVSISQIAQTQKQQVFLYNDLLKNQEYKIELSG